MLKHWFFCKDIPKNTQNHKAYVKKNHTWCELGRDSSLGVKEGGTGLLDLDSGDSVCRCGVCRATRGRVGEGCGWLARLFVLKMKMVWESQKGIWMKNRRWINLILLQSEWECGLWGAAVRIEGAAARSRWRGENLGLIRF
jgi:hypothetical protein